MEQLPPGTDHDSQNPPRTPYIGYFANAPFLLLCIKKYQQLPGPRHFNSIASQT
jgi:hypothetical protein